MKQKSIIVAQGTANIGKSMTLSRLGRILVNSGSTTTGNTSRGDYNVTMSYISKLIGIQTFGDSPGLVKTGLTDFLNMSCDIIVIASKGYGATVMEIESFAKTNNYRVIWTSPYKVWDGSISANDIKDYSASHLKLMIDDIISGRL